MVELRAEDDPETRPAGEPRDLGRHIARVAARLFAERGYEATSVREIVEEAGVARPTLYSHFGSKEGLAQAVLIVPMTRLVETLRAHLDEPMDPLCRLEAIAEAYFRFSRDDPDRARFVYALFFGPPGSCLNAAVSRFADDLNRLIAAAVGKVADIGRVEPGQVAACTLALRGLIVIHTMDFLYRGRALEPDLAGRVVRAVVAGFGRPPAELLREGE